MIANNIKYLSIFLFLNFLALYLGAYFTGDGVVSSWYQNANQAPWTPPGWVFGAAWTAIMICYAVYMSRLINIDNSSKQWWAYSIQWLLNVVWNQIFFYYQKPILAQLVIVLLTSVVFYQWLSNFKRLKAFSWLLVPYLIWLIIANSFNAYFVLNN